MKAFVKCMLGLLLCVVFLLPLMPSALAADTKTANTQENACQGSIKLTVDSLGLAANQYSDGTADVDGIAVEWTNQGNYGEGIQMEEGDNGYAMIWNTEPLPGSITKVVFTYSSTRSAWETENMFVRLGSEAKTSDESTLMVTDQGYKIISVLFKSNDYKYFWLEWYHRRTSYCESIEVYYNIDSHDYQAEVTAPTCTAEGYTTYTCTQCGDSYVSDNVPATGHHYGYWSVEKEATCGEYGVIARYCKDCTEKQTDLLEKLKHHYTSEVVAPTCLEEGCTIYSCTVCGSSYCDDYTAATGHSLGDWMIDSYPTCLSKGCLYRKCEYCDYREEGVAAATGHRFVDGVCTTCGTVASVVPELTMNYPSLSFEDEIFYNVYFTVDHISDVAEMGLITFHSRLANGTLADAVDVIPGFVSNGSVCMVRSNGIPAKNLGDTLYFKVYAKLSDGTYAYSEIAGYNAVAYANTVLNDANASDKAKALVVSMLNYGAAAQEYFGYKTDALMSAGLTAQQQALVPDYDAAMVQDVVKADFGKVGAFVMNGGYSNIYPTVSFEGAFAINFYFTPDRAVDAAPVLYYWDAETYAGVDVLTPENATGVLTMAQDGSNWGAAVEGIAAKAVDETVYVAGFYTGDGVAYPTNVIAYSLGNYCKTIADNGEAFGAATAVYGFCAKAYFA